MFTYPGIAPMNSNQSLAGNRLRVLAVAAALTLASAQIQAAPGPLSTMPLFLAKGVQPNIFFLLDDSGSMDWEVLMSAGAIDKHGTNINNGNLDFDPGDTAEDIREHCLGYNVMAYNPDYTYTPWYGVDTADKAFTDQSVKSAWVNPYTGGGSSGACDDNGEVNNDNGVTCNLLSDFDDGQVADKKGAFYVPWNDSNGDGVYQAGECSTDATERVYVQDLTAAQQTNYANWFSYYRKREYVMKRALSQIIAESRDRLGLGVINNVLALDDKHDAWSKTNAHIIDHEAVGVQVKDVDDLTLPVDATAVTNKKELLDNLLGVNSSGGTPLRINLKYVGDYFRGTLAGSSPFGFVPVKDADSASGHSPILNEDLGGSCQQNFAVVLSDGFWNSTTSPKVGNADADDTSNAFDGQSYADGVADTLADVAMSIYKGDLIAGLDNKVPPVAIPKGSDANVACYDTNNDRSQECFDTNDAQHLVTFTVSFGLTGEIPLNADGTPCIPGNRTKSVVDQGWPSSCGAGSNGWPTPVKDEKTTADDMQHAAWNGRGLYLAAKNPDELINRLRQAIGNISARKPAAAAAVALDTFNVTNGGLVYQGQFDSGTWGGELHAKNIVVKPDGTVAIGAEKWASPTTLAAMSIADRIMVTYNGSDGIPFVFPTDYTKLDTTKDLDSSQVNDLLYNAPATDQAARQAYGESLVDYLRGSVANEGNGTANFRQRYGSRLGDIIHSAPVFVGNPDPETYPNTIAPNKPYQEWANNKANDTPPGAYGRQSMLYVGANDGALHAFKADTGEEVFAYYPKAVFSAEERLGLHWLADPVYEHRYYVDIEPAVGEVYVDTGDADGLTWRTVLVGGLRGGGRGIYALDVSDPGEFTDASGVAGNVLWEFTHPDLGYTYSKPTIVKLNDGRWAAVFGNGYNPDPTVIASHDVAAGTPITSGEAVLFIKYLDTASPSGRAITTKVGSIASGGGCLDAGSDCNGLSTPAVVDLGADRVADRVYAGDLKGNLWVFDLSSSDPAQWKPAYGTLTKPEPLFSAYYLDGSNEQPQPITSQPMVTLHPTKRQDATSPNTMVFFGTGQYITENDPLTTGTNSFYGIWDGGATIDFERGSTDSVLVKQTITNETGTLGGDAKKEVRTLSNNPVNYDTSKGWFADLPDKGERVTVTPIIYAGHVLYSTMVPASDLCSDSAGYGWLMAHNLADGSEPSFTILDVTGDGNFDASDQVGDKNVAGVKYDSPISQPGLVDKEGNPFLVLPVDDGTKQLELQKPLTRATRSSWGIFRYED